MVWPLIGLAGRLLLGGTLRKMFAAAAVDQMAFDGAGSKKLLNLGRNVVESAADKAKDSLMDNFGLKSLGLDNLTQEQGMGIAAVMALTAFMGNNQNNGMMGNMLSTLLVGAVALYFKDEIGQAVNWGKNALSGIFQKNAAGTEEPAAPAVRLQNAPAFSPH